MTRKLAFIVGVLFSAVTAGGLLAQTSAPAKPTPKSSMQHAPAANPSKTAGQDTTKAYASAASHTVWTKAQITEAQEGLAKAGDYKGKPTGVMDHRTRKAIRAYQKANKLPVTGRLDNDVLNKLRSA